MMDQPKYNAYWDEAYACAAYDTLLWVRDHLPLSDADACVLRKKINEARLSYAASRLLSAERPAVVKQ